MYVSCKQLPVRQFVLLYFRSMCHYGMVMTNEAIMQTLSSQLVSEKQNVYKKESFQ